MGRRPLPLRFPSAYGRAMPDAATIRRVFEEIHRATFVLDPDGDTRPGIDVIDAGLAGDTPTFVLTTPWTVSGLAFPPDEHFPETLEIEGRQCRAYPIEVPALGWHRSVNLLADAAALPTLAQARMFAQTLAPLFRAAVARTREPARRVAHAR